MRQPAAAPATVPADVVYPCSDGKPVAESWIHLQCMIYVIKALERHFEKRARGNVFVGGDMFVYYEQGNPRAVVAPDVFVVVGAPTRLRDSYMLWKEPGAPDFVLEVTSRSTREEDEEHKKDVYAMLGVTEYFLYDPRAEYLTPSPLVGYRLRNGTYRPLPAVAALPGGGVRLHSEVLGLDLRDSRGERMVRLHDPATGQDFLTYHEAERAREDAEARADEAEARVRKAEAHNAALRARLLELERAPVPASPRDPPPRTPQRR